MDTDEQYMKLALRLARRGLGKTSPNPMVGAVIVRDGRVIGQGYHRYFGGKHAEINALEGAGGGVAGGTLYVTLEPCCYQGKTPPCTGAIIGSGLGRVVIGALDPNPRVNGKSVALLQQSGIETKAGVLEEACRALNEPHFKLMETGTPLVTVKFAETLDGRIATASGQSRWLSSPPSLRLAHRLRALSDAVLVGAGTVAADNPQLTVRLVRGKNPTRVVLDSALSLPPDAAVFTGTEVAPTIVATTAGADGTKAAALRRQGVEVIVTEAGAHGEVDLKQLLDILGKRGIASLLVEGGAATITSFLRLGLADRLVAFVTPKLMGKGIEAVGELGIRDVSRAVRLTFTRSYRSGEDIIIEARLA